MPFLPPNAQRQSTESKYLSIYLSVYISKYAVKSAADLGGDGGEGTVGHRLIGEGDVYAVRPGVLRSELGRGAVWCRRHRARNHLSRRRVADVHL